MASIKCFNRHDLAGKDCYGCTERHVGCHGTCEKYIENKKLATRRKSKIDAEKRIDKEIIVHEASVANRMKKARNTKK